MTQHPLQLLAASFKAEHAELPESPEDGICCITGLRTETVKRRFAIGKSFTNLDLLAAPDSNRIGVDAYQALKYKWQRMACWMCDGDTFRKLQRLEIRDLVLNGVAANKWCGHITTSYKKHGGLRARINKEPYGFWVFDEKVIDCRDNEKINQWYDMLDKAIRSGLGRNVLLSLNAPAYVIGRVGVDYWLEFVRWSTPKYQSGLYELLVYLLPSIAELKEEKKKNEPKTVKNNVSHGRQRSLF